MWLFIVLVISLFSVLLYRLQKKGDLVRSSKQFKTDIKEWPVLGHTYMFMGSHEDRMTAFQTLGREAIKQGGLTYNWQVNMLYIVIADAEIATTVLKTCLEKDDIVRYIRGFIGNGTAFAPVNIWRRRRKILLPTFNSKNLKNFMDVFSKQSTVLVKQMQRSADNGPFSLWKYLTTFTFDSVCETALGVQFKAQNHPKEPYLEAFNEITEITTNRMCQPWLHNETIFKMTPAYTRHEKCKKMLYDFVDEVIKTRRELLNTPKNSEEMTNGLHNDENVLKPFLQLILESFGNNGITDLELREETLVLALAGTDTTAVGSSFTLLMLSKYPHVQEKVYAELRKVLGDTDRPVVADDLPHLKYLDAVIKETLRLYPPVPVIVRKVENEVTLPSGITLVPDTITLVNIWAIHRNPKYWGADADQFKPERFLEGELAHPAAWMPFSYGPRNCIGYQFATMSMKTVLASLVRAYRVLPPNDKTDLEEPLRIEFNFTMRHVDDFVVQLKTRD